MNRDRILSIIRQPENIGPGADMPLVKELIEAFPFYAAPHALLARLMYDEKSIYFDKHLRLGAAYIGSRERLYDLLHGGQSDVAVLVEEEETEEMTKAEERTPLPPKVEKPEPTPAAIVAHPIVTEVPVEAPVAEEKKEVLEPELTQAREEIPQIPEQEIKPAAPAVEEKKSFAIEIPSFASYDYFAYYDKVLKKADQESGKQPLDLSGLNEEREKKSAPVPVPDYTLPVKKEKDPESDALSFSAWLSKLKTPGPKAEEASPAPKIEALPTDTKTRKSAKNTDKPVSVDDIISNFIAQEPRIKPKPSKFFSPEDMARQSAEQDASLATETLAEIYLRQGLSDKAIEIYRELSTRFPLKSSYFAAKIREVKP